MLNMASDKSLRAQIKNKIEASKCRLQADILDREKMKRRFAVDKAKDTVIKEMERMRRQTTGCDPEGVPPEGPDDPVHRTTYFKASSQTFGAKGLQKWRIKQRHVEQVKRKFDLGLAPIPWEQEEENPFGQSFRIVMSLMGYDPDVVEEIITGSQQNNGQLTEEDWITLEQESTVDVFEALKQPPQSIGVGNVGNGLSGVAHRGGNVGNSLSGVAQVTDQSQHDSNGINGVPASDDKNKDEYTSCGKNGLKNRAFSIKAWEDELVKNYTQTVLNPRPPSISTNGAPRGKTLRHNDRAILPSKPRINTSRNSKMKPQKPKDTAEPHKHRKLRKSKPNVRPHSAIVPSSRRTSSSSQTTDVRPKSADARPTVGTGQLLKMLTEEGSVASSFFSSSCSSHDFDDEEVDGSSIMYLSRQDDVDVPHPLGQNGFTEVSNESNTSVSSMGHTSSRDLTQQNRVSSDMSIESNEQTKDDCNGNKVLHRLSSPPGVSEEWSRLNEPIKRTVSHNGYNKHGPEEYQHDRIERELNTISTASTDSYIPVEYLTSTETISKEINQELSLPNGVSHSSVTFSDDKINNLDKDKPIVIPTGQSWTTEQESTESLNDKPFTLMKESELFKDNPLKKSVSFVESMEGEYQVTIPSPNQLNRRRMTVHVPDEDNDSEDLTSHRDLRRGSAPSPLQHLPQWKRQLMMESPPAVNGPRSNPHVKLVRSRSQRQRDLEQMVDDNVSDMKTIFDQEHSRRLKSRVNVVMTVLNVQRAAEGSREAAGVEDSVQGGRRGSMVPGSLDRRSSGVVGLETLAGEGIAERRRHSVMFDLANRRQSIMIENGNRRPSMVDAGKNRRQSMVDAGTQRPSTVDAGKRRQSLLDAGTGTRRQSSADAGARRQNVLRRASSFGNDSQRPVSSGIAARRQSAYGDIGRHLEHQALLTPQYEEVKINRHSRLHEKRASVTADILHSQLERRRASVMPHKSPLTDTFEDLEEEEASIER